VVTSAHGGRSIYLYKDVPVTVGREPPSTVCVPDLYLSRVHARFTLLPGRRVLVEDLGSRNGTWLGGKACDRVEVSVGSVLIMGHASTARVFDQRISVPGPRPARAPMVAGPIMREVLATAARVAAAKLPVILLGETGTGKELFARFIHEESPRGSHPMVNVNCAALPTQLVESILFGHEKGAFTGAGAQHRGVFEAADGGSVFLDEVGELPQAAQAALLRVVELGQFTRVGGTSEVAVDVRVIAATHRDLDRMCAEGAFRSDLFFRLSALTISLPPLRERVEDIESLALAFLASAEGGASRSLSPAALGRLRSYAWPGNVRELRNAVERAAILAMSLEIQEHDLPARVLMATMPRDEDAAPESVAAPVLADHENVEGDLRTHLLEHQRRVVLSTLESVAWSRVEAAQRLGLPLRTLAHRMNVLGIKRPVR